MEQAFFNSFDNGDKFLMLDIKALILKCVVDGVSAQTVGKVIQVESAGNPWAINVNQKAVLIKKAEGKDEAVSQARSFLAKGYSIDVGLMQINSENFKKYSLDITDVFDPCINIRVGSSILKEAYSKTSKKTDDRQIALQKALSIYNTGSSVKGYQNGYVKKYYHNSQFQNPYSSDLSVDFSAIYEREETDDRAKKSEPESD